MGLTKSVEIGRVYVNKTWKYLLPATNAYGELYKLRMENVYKLAAGYGDACYARKADKCIFVLLDRLFYPDKYNHTMRWLRHQEYYVADYPFDGMKGRMQMVIIKIPQQYHQAYERFVEGKYSQMYSPEDIKELFKNASKNETREDVVDILERRASMASKHLEKIKNSFGNVSLTLADMVDFEYDFPPTPKYEIFNH